MTVTVEDLRALCGTGLVQLHAWASYEMPPSVVTITVRPQQAFRPERLVLPRPQADRWRIHDIKIGNRSQFGQAGPVPGEAFTGVGAALALDAMAPTMDLMLAVEYVGDVSGGEEFNGTFVGRHADGGQGRVVLPIRSNAPIRVVDCGRRVLLDLGDDLVYRFEERRGVLDRIVVTTAAEFAPIKALHEGHVDGLPVGVDDPPRDVDVRVPPRPLLIALHARSFDDGGRVLFAIDEISGTLVFDICQRSVGFSIACDLAGYVPPWWGALPEIEVRGDAS